MDLSLHREQVWLIINLVPIAALQAVDDDLTKKIDDKEWCPL